MVTSQAGTSLVGTKVSPPLILPSPTFTIPEPRSATVLTDNLRTLYVYLCNGSVEAVGLCKSMKLSDSDLIVRLDDGSARRFRRADVYFASWGQVTPPVMF